MPPRKSQRQLADEAYLRMEQMTIGEQVSIESAPPPALPTLDHIPQNCPECRRGWSASGGVAPMMTDPRQLTFLSQIQCAGCGNIFLVTPEEHATLAAAIKADYAARQRAPLPKTKRSKRERGAG